MRSNRVTWCESQYQALQSADALVIVTEWKSFRSPDLEAIRAALKAPLIFDGRNLFDPRRCGTQDSSTRRSDVRCRRLPPPRPERRRRHERSKVRAQLYFLGLAAMNLIHRLLPFALRPLL
jgi:hypothetical protein